jgi:hypothetical protein
MTDKYRPPVLRDIVFQTIIGSLNVAETAKFKDAMSQAGGPERAWLIAQLKDVGDLVEEMITELRGGVTDMDALTRSVLPPPE